MSTCSVGWSWVAPGFLLCVGRAKGMGRSNRALSLAMHVATWEPVGAAGGRAKGTGASAPDSAAHGP